MLTSGSDDQTVRIWNVVTSHVAQTLKGRSGSASSVVFLSEGNKSRLSYSVDESRTWVTQNELRILYLPLDYRPCRVAVKGSILAIGTANGRVTIIIFRSDVKAGTMACL